MSSKSRLVFLLSPLFLAILVTISLFLVSNAKKKSVVIPSYGIVKDFSFQDQNGAAVGLKDFAGRLWVSNFIFTRCRGPCPLLTQKMSRLRSELPGSVNLVSWTVDPEFDTPGVLSDYAQRHQALDDRWKFLTGPPEELRSFIRGNFFLPVEGSGSDSEHSILHSLNIVLVDQNGEIRGFFDSSDPNEFDDLIASVRRLLPRPVPPWARELPAFNASLNALSAICILFGILLIRLKRVVLHQAAMSAAVMFSFLFLVSYLVYHYYAGSTPFQGQGWIRPIYFFILISHIILAMAVVPLVAMTLWWAAKKDFPKHVNIARWSFPIWLYVSVTGVIVYWMLYPSGSGMN